MNRRNANSNTGSSATTTTSSNNTSNNATSSSNNNSSSSTSKSSNESAGWQLSGGEVLQYKQHVQQRIQQDLQDSLAHLTQHQQQLAELNRKLSMAKLQVIASVAESKEKVHDSCDGLLQQLTDALINRRTELLERLDQVEQESLSPLLECEVVLNTSITDTRNLLHYGAALAAGGYTNITAGAPLKSTLISSLDPDTEQTAMAIKQSTDVNSPVNKDTNKHPSDVSYTDKKGSHTCNTELSIGACRRTCVSRNTAEPDNNSTDPGTPVNCPTGAAETISAAATEKTSSLIVTKDRISKFQTKAALNNCLPSVPELCSVACASVLFESTTAQQLLPVLQQYGTVRRQGPVQITLVHEKPGALMLYWEEVIDEDEDDNTEQREFVLQCSNASTAILDDATAVTFRTADNTAAADTIVTASTISATTAVTTTAPLVTSAADAVQYRTVYQGSEDSFLLQQLCTGANYWLRVTRKTSVPDAEVTTPKAQSTTGLHEGLLDAWSLPKLCSTTVPHYRWDAGSSDNNNTIGWRVADDGRLASKESNECCVITSSSAQLLPDCTITLQVVVAGVGCSDEGFAVSWQPLTTQRQLTAPGTLFVGATGSVVVDGVQRLMQLPALCSGSCVSYSVEQPDPRTPKLRIHVETADKLVTYEWAVPTSIRKEPRLYFSACFADQHWSIRVY
uniref:Cytokine receptor-like factor 3 n=2 Tax=Hirondellea gigas TaxID=1518452 RepID=A0A6A7FQI7_9CRUS